MTQPPNATPRRCPHCLRVLVIALTYIALPCASVAEFGRRRADAEDLKIGIEQRQPWTSSRIIGTPEPPPPFVTERAFPNLKFNQCLDLVKPPGSDRFFIAEQSGKIFSFPDREDASRADLVIDIKKAIPGVTAVYAITFHPNFQQNGYCYVCYIKTPNVEDGTHVARFQVSDNDPPTIDAATERPLVTWWSGGHNGCCLKFGPDGYLYISTGDAAPANPPDTKRAGQDVSNLLSAVLRIDVDHADAPNNYRIPSDNPFVGLDGARGEIWAYGFRNPWRMSFDRKTGDLWVGDVGWELWEMLDRVQRGGNYGWGVMEGRQLTHPEWNRGPTPILPPTIDHPHSESSSITDGLTYYGSRLPELQGMHIYGDYDTGKFWAFRWKDGRVADHREIADTTLRIVGFGEDLAGEFYILDHPAGTIHRLIPNPNRNQTSRFPRKLSETGLFSSTVDQTPAAGVIPYSINAQPWADFATAQRFVAVPNLSSITTGTPAFKFPKESVLVKTLSLEMERGNAATRRKLETQILHFDGADWHPYTYRWNASQSDAELTDATGAEQTLDIVDPQAPGGVRRQTWRFSGRAECQRCHNRWSGPPLGFNTPQLNKPHDYEGGRASQLGTFAHLKLIENIDPAKETELPKLADPYARSTSEDVAQRARAYLHVNCGHCHRMHAGSAVLSYMHHDLSLEKTNMIGSRPSQGTFGIHAAQVVAPGDPHRSVLLYRMAKLGGGRMPRIGSSEVDTAGLKLMRTWIESLSEELDKNETGDVAAARLRRREQSQIKKLQAAGPDDSPELLLDLLASTRGSLTLLGSIDQGSLPEAQVATAVALAAKSEDVRIRDLFERFLPPDERVQRLGVAVRPEQILRLTGDASRGKRLFFTTGGVQCQNCHKVGTQGKDLGPPLTEIGKKLDRAQLLESILQPSKRIDSKYLTYVAETIDGRLVSGLLVKQDKEQIVLKDLQGKLIQLPRSQVEQLAPHGRSLMPELLLRDMTGQQVADLLAYLRSLK